MEHYLARLQKAVRENWNKEALCDYRGSTYTFSKVAVLVEKIHIFLERAGIRKGDRIAVCARNSAGWGIAFLASNTYGAVTVPILADFTPENISSLVDHSGSQLLYTDREIWRKMDPEAMKGLRAAICISDFSLLFSRDETVSRAASTVEMLFYDRYPDGMKPEDVTYPVDNDRELALINYTSGTTSAPKGVMIRYESISSNVEFGQYRIPSRPSDRLVSMLPMAHMYGLMFELIYPLCGGTAVYYLGKTPSPTLLMQAMKDVRPYLLVTVPLVMEKIFRNAVLPAVSTPHMKVLTALPFIRKVIFRKIREKLMSAFGGNVKSIVMGGAALNPEVEMWLGRLGIPYTVGYGMTEAAPLLAYEDWSRFKPKSCGKVVDRCELRIDSEDPQRIAGEIQARGTSIMSGYYRNPEATAAAFTEDGWMRTGDLGVIDAEGNVFIKGRSKNLILSSDGQNIYPEEIETLFNSQPFVLESVVVKRERRLVALVFADIESLRKAGISGAEAVRRKLDEIRENVNRMLPAYSRIAVVELSLEPFVKTPKMSIKRYLYK